MLEELKDANSYIIGKIEEKDSLILEMENYILLRLTRRDTIKLKRI